MHGVDPRERAGLVRELDDPADVGRGADRVRGGREGDDFRPRRALGRQVVEIERQVVVDVDEADDDADVLGEREPRRDVPVVVEPRDEHLVAGLELAGEGTREEEVESGHALPERDLAGIAAEERGGTLVRGIDHLVRPARGLVGRADVRVVLAQVPGDRVDHLVGALRPTRAVEEREPAVEGAEAGAHRADIQERRAHATLHVYAGATVSDAR